MRSVAPHAAAWWQIPGNMALSPPASGSPAGVAFMPRQLGPNGRLLIEIAWGADLNGSPDAWPWTDVTTDVRQVAGFDFTYGRADQASQSQPATGQMTFKNDQARYSLGGASPNYPNVRENVPIRVRVDPDGTGFRVAFQGNVIGFRPDWESLTGTIPIAVATIAGTMQRLIDTGNEISCPQRYLTTVSPAPAIYYPLNDGPLATFGRPAVQGAPTSLGDGRATVRPAFPTDAASPYLGAGDLAPWLPEGAALRDNALIFAVLPATPRVTLEWYVGVLINFSTGGTTAGLLDELAVSEAPDGVVTWALYMDYGGRQVSLVGPAGILLTQPEDILFDGQIHFVELQLLQQGADVLLNAYCDGVSFVSTVVTGRTIAHPTTVLLFSQGNSNRFWGHLPVWYNGSRPDNAQLVAEMMGASTHTGFLDYSETALQRANKIKNQTDILLDIVGDTGNPGDTVYMGPQAIKDNVGLLREIEEADRGNLYDGTGPGLTLVTRAHIENAPAVMTINVGDRKLSPGFRPEADGTRRVNRAKVRRTFGSEFTYEDTAGKYGTLAIGVKEDGSLQVNADTDDSVRDFAGWLVNLGTYDGYRYPQVTVNLGATPELAPGVLALRPGDRLDLTGLRTVFPTHDRDEVSLIVEGVSMAFGPDTWEATFQCSLYDPWRIIVLAADAGDTAELLCHLAPDGSSLTSSVLAGDTSMTVATPSGPLWSTAADDYPFYVGVGDIRARVTAVSGASSPQTFTIDPMPLTRSANSPVEIWRPTGLRL